MNWFWLCSRLYRRIPSAGGLPHGSAGRLVWRKAARGGACAPGSAWCWRGLRPGALVRSPSAQSELLAIVRGAFELAR